MASEDGKEGGFLTTGSILSFAAGLLGPLAMAAACVFEALARRLAKKTGCDETRLERLRSYADAGLVAAWLLLAAAYLLFRYLAPDAAALEPSFQRWMTWMLGALLVLDLLYLYLRRARPRKPGGNKRFWEV